VVCAVASDPTRQLQPSDSLELRIIRSVLLTLALITLLQLVWPEFAELVAQVWRSFVEGYLAIREFSAHAP
jgi:hypothetical protein